MRKGSEAHVRALFVFPRMRACCPMLELGDAQHNTSWSRRNDGMLRRITLSLAALIRSRCFSAMQGERVEPMRWLPCCEQMLRRWAHHECVRRHGPTPTRRGPRGPPGRRSASSAGRARSPAQPADAPHCPGRRSRSRPRDVCAGEVHAVRTTSPFRCSVKQGFGETRGMCRSSLHCSVVPIRSKRRRSGPERRPSRRSCSGIGRNEGFCRPTSDKVGSRSTPHMSDADQTMFQIWSTSATVRRKRLAYVPNLLRIRPGEQVSANFGIMSQCSSRGLCGAQ